RLPRWRRSTEGRRPARRTVTPATRPLANTVRLAVARRPLLSPATEKRAGTQTGGGLPERPRPHRRHRPALWYWLRAARFRQPDDRPVTRPARHRAGATRRPAGAS